MTRGRVPGRMRHNGPDVGRVTVSIPIVFIVICDVICPLRAWEVASAVTNIFVGPARPDQYKHLLHLTPGPGGQQRRGIKIP